MKKIVLLILLGLIKPVFAYEMAVSSKTILEKMVIQIQSIQNIRYNLHAIERVNGKYLNAYSEIKINIYPRKVYLKNTIKNLEVLYSEGTNNNDALVNPGKFPYLTLNLNPNKSIMRKGQHHTIDDLGFQYVSNIVANNFPANPKQFDKVFINLGIVNVQGKPCYKIYNEYKDFKYIRYTIKRGDTVRNISTKFNCGDYRIMEKNPIIKINEPLTEGTTILVPNYYANKTLLYIDVTSYLPVSITTNDNEGLYESYEFSNIQVNTIFNPSEFQRDYTGYNF